MKKHAKHSTADRSPFVRARICRNPIFVIGCPRSGTSILAWSLAQHSKLWCSHESDFLYYLFGDDCINVAYRTAVLRPDGNWLQAAKVGQAEFQKYAGLGINALFTSRSRGKRWIDQSPTYTLIPDILAEMFPGAFFVHILRDGRKTVHSMIHSGFDIPWARDFSEACRTWRMFVERAFDFSARFPKRCLNVTNEAISRRPIASFKRILSFVGVTHELAPAAFFQSNRINSSFQTSQGVPPVKSVRAPRAWDDWSSDQRKIFLEHAAPTLIRCGYATATELGLQHKTVRNRKGEERRQSKTAGSMEADHIESETIHGLRKALAEQSAWAQRSADDVIMRDAIIRSLQDQLNQQAVFAQRATGELAVRDSMICSLQQQLHDLTNRMGAPRSENGSWSEAPRTFEQQVVSLVAPPQAA